MGEGRVTQRLGIERTGAIVPGAGDSRSRKRRLAYLQENDKAVLVYATFPSLETAEAEATRLVEAGLAACVNILPGMISIYVWDGQRHRDAEVVMIVKTRRSLADRVVAETRRRHPYDNPALLVLSVEGGSADYIGWLLAETKPPASGP